MDAENVAATGIRSPGRPFRSESQHQLSYTGQLLSYLSFSYRTLHKRARYSTPTYVDTCQREKYWRIFISISLSATYADKDIPLPVQILITTHFPQLRTICEK